MHIVVLTGAGMSAESGIPTFRDTPNSFWANYDPARLATLEGFREDSPMVWGWYRWRAARVQQSAPNSGHIGLAELERLGHRVSIVTQNIDDLHERAGSTEVLHLHGHLLRSRCTTCGARQFPDPILPAHSMEIGEGGREPPPQCQYCGDVFRPDIVWFGENLPQAPWQAAMQAIGECELMVVIGTSGMVYPAAGLPETAKSQGVEIIEINPEFSGITQLADHYWALPASTGVAQLLQRLGDANSFA